MTVEPFSVLVLGSGFILANTLPAGLASLHRWSAFPYMVMPTAWRWRVGSTLTEDALSNLLFLSRYSYDESMATQLQSAHSISHHFGHFMNYYQLYVEHIYIVGHS